MNQSIMSCVLKVNHRLSQYALDIKRMGCLLRMGCWGSRMKRLVGGLINEKYPTYAFDPRNSLELTIRSDAFGLVGVLIRDLGGILSGSCHL